MTDKLFRSEFERCPSPVKSKGSEHESQKRRYNVSTTINSVPSFFQASPAIAEPRQWEKVGTVCDQVLWMAPVSCCDPCACIQLYWGGNIPCIHRFSMCSAAQHVRAHTFYIRVRTKRGRYRPIYRNKKKKKRKKENRKLLKGWKMMRGIWPLAGTLPQSETMRRTGWDGELHLKA